MLRTQPTGLGHRDEPTTANRRFHEVPASSKHAVDVWRCSNSNDANSRLEYFKRANPFSTCGAGHSILARCGTCFIEA